MAVQEQLADFNAFAAELVRREGESALTLEEVYDRWWSARHRDEDLAAIRLAAADYERGDRGEDARAELAAHRTERAGPTQ
jgi:hypothetical protein